MRLFDSDSSVRIERMLCISEGCANRPLGGFWKEEYDVCI